METWKPVKQYTPFEKKERKLHKRFQLGINEVVEECGFGVVTLLMYFVRSGHDIHNLISFCEKNHISKKWFLIACEACWEALINNEDRSESE